MCVCVCVVQCSVVQEKAASNTLSAAENETAVRLESRRPPATVNQTRWN